MSSFNDRIRQVQVKNFTTPPQNLPEFQNPYLLVSKNKAYNQLATRTSSASATKKKTQKKINLKDEEDLARHAMKEVYENADNRRNIYGYTLDTSFIYSRTLSIFQC